MMRCWPTCGRRHSATPPDDGIDERTLNSQDVPHPAPYTAPVEGDDVDAGEQDSKKVGFWEKQQQQQKKKEEEAKQEGGRGEVEEADDSDLESVESVEEEEDDLVSISTMGTSNMSLFSTPEQVQEVRPLGGFEKFFETSMPLGLGLIYMVADIEGPVDSFLLQRAMRMSIKRHPNLRSKIVKGRFEAVPFSKIPEFEVPLVQSDDVLIWTGSMLVIDDIGRSLDRDRHTSSGAQVYPWALYLHRCPRTEHQQLVFFIHHSFSDGDSINRLLQELVQSMAKQLQLHSDHSRSRLVTETSTLPQLPAVDLQLQANYKGNKTVTKARGLYAEAKKLMKSPRVPTPVSRVSVNERTTAVTSFTVEPAVLKRILAGCKAHDTTLTGALAAACAQEMQCFIHGGKKRYMVKLDVLINFRSKVPTVNGQRSAEAHQLFAAPVDILLMAGGKSGSEFWDAARLVRKEVLDFLNRPSRIADTLAFLNWLGGKIGLRRMKKVAQGAQQGRSKAISISNLGVTDKLFQSVGPFSVGKTQWGIDQGFIGHTVFFAVSSYKGALNFTLSYCESAFTREMAEEYGHGVIRRCLAACPARTSKRKVIATLKTSLSTMNGTSARLIAAK